MGKIIFGNMNVGGERIRTAHLGSGQYLSANDVERLANIRTPGFRQNFSDDYKLRVKYRGVGPNMLFIQLGETMIQLMKVSTADSYRLFDFISDKKGWANGTQEGISDNPFYPANHGQSQDVANGLIPLTEDENGETAVSGRALHEFLGIGRDYTTWFKKMTEYGFTAGQDYLPTSGEVARAGRGTVQRKDHVLTLDMAKELSMIQRTERGKQARQYFIEVEKKARAPQFEVPQTYAAALRAAADATDRAELAENKVTELEPRAKSYDRFMKDDDHLMTWDRVARLLNMGRNNLLKQLRDEGILMDGMRGETWNIPYQRYQHHFDLKVKEITTRRGDEITSTKVRVKPSGLDYIAKRLGLEAVAA